MNVGWAGGGGTLERHIWHYNEKRHQKGRMMRQLNEATAHSVAHSATARVDNLLQFVDMLGLSTCATPGAQAF